MGIDKNAYACTQTYVVAQPMASVSALHNMIYTGHAELMLPVLMHSMCMLVSNTAACKILYTCTQRQLSLVKMFVMQRDKAAPG